MAIHLTDEQAEVLAHVSAETVAQIFMRERSGEQEALPEEIQQALLENLEEQGRKTWKPRQMERVRQGLLRRLREDGLAALLTEEGLEAAIQAVLPTAMEKATEKLVKMLVSLEE